MPIRTASLNKRISANGQALHRAMMSRTETYGADHEPSEAEAVLIEERRLLKEDRDKRKALIFELQAYMRQSFPTAYLVQLGGIYGVSARADWWSPRNDDKVLLFQNNVVSSKAGASAAK